MKIIKKSIAIIISIAIVVSAFSSFASHLTAFAESGESTDFPKHVSKEILSSDNYDDVTSLVDMTDGDSIWNALYVAYKNSSAAVFPVANPIGDGVVLAHGTSYEQGAVYIGADFTTPSKVKEQTIAVEPGKTYTVSFDYYTTGTAANPLNVWLAAGNTNDKVVSYHEGSAVNVISIAQNTDMTMDGWKTVTASITIPSDLDTTNYPYLILASTFGSKLGKIYFDNVSTTVVSVTSIIAQCNYDTVTSLVDMTDGDSIWKALYVDYKNSSAAVFPVANPIGDGVVLAYGSTHDYGAVYIGADFTTPSKVREQTVAVKPGNTYTVTFDYYTTGIAGNPLNVWLAAGNTNDKVVSYHEGSAVNVISVAQDSDMTMDGWKTVTATITIPSDLDTTTYPYLILTSNFGSSEGRIYFDNVSTKIDDNDTYLQFKDKSLSSNNYDNVTSLVDMTDGDSIWKALYVDYKNSSAAVFPVANPIGDGVVLVYGSTHDYGAVYIGADFTTPSKVREQTVAVKPGNTYTVTFDYYTTGIAGNPLNVWLAAGNTNDKVVSYHEGSAVNVISVAQDSDMTMDGWKTVTATITIPSDLDTTTYPYLILTSNFGSSEGRIYFDNVSAFSYAPLCVNYTIGNKSDCEIFYDGVFSSEPFKSEDNSVLWYTDVELKNSFSSSTIIDSSTLEVIELYGVYENSTSALVKGDVNLDNNFSGDDLVEMRKILLNDSNVSSQFRTDVNNDNYIDVIDLVRMKKALAEVFVDTFTINGNILSNYKIVIPTSDPNYNSGIVSNKVETLKSLINSDVVTDSDEQSNYEIIIGNANREGVIDANTKGSYFVLPVGNKLYVNGGSQNALIAALEALIGSIRTGNHINDTNFIDFEFTGEYISDNGLTVLSTGFDTDMEAGGAKYSNSCPYYSFFGSDAADFYLGTRADTPGVASAFSGYNISASNGCLVMDASDKQSITFTEDGITTTYDDTYIGSEIRGKYFTYGYAEISAKINVCDGVCAAFWLVEDTDTSGTPYYEIDIFEALGKDACTTLENAVKGSAIEHKYVDGVHQAPELRFGKYEILIDGQYELCTKENQSNLYVKNFINDGKFHKYAIEWNKDYIYWIYDDVRVMRLKLEEGQFASALRPVLTIYSGWNVKDNNYETGTPENVTEDQWNNQSSFEIDYFNIYSENFVS